MDKLPFNSLYAHGFCRVAVCVPRMRNVVPAKNAEATIALARQAAERHAVLAIFPELGLSGYTADELFFQDALLGGVEDALAEIVAASRDITLALVVGAPLRLENKIFNCAIVIQGGAILGIVPKTYLPNYREFYEKRYFTSATEAFTSTIRLLGADVPFGTDMIFVAERVPGFALHVEICEDLWTPLPPSTFGALAGATVLTNLSASNITVGKAGYRHLLCSGQSSRCISAYLYSAAGQGESTTDLAWDGHGLIYENGTPLAETERFAREPQIISADIDLDRLTQDRSRSTSFNDCAGLWRDRLSTMRRIALPIAPPAGEIALSRAVERFPYVPADPKTRDERCGEVYAIQVQALATRLETSGIKKSVIGISGGLDSTHALIVLAKCYDELGWARSDILAYTMPGFGTTEKTRGNAWALMEALGVTAEEIDIRPSARQMLTDLKHPYASGEPVYDVTFENVQAGERTSHLFRLANFHSGMVIGTSDLSELALGFTTYGVGDHMAHYHVNASVPKTLVQYLVRWAVATRQFDERTSAILQAIVDTEISPELIPASEDRPVHRSEDTVGPYPLQDFNMYYLTRFGYRPSKVAYLARHAWGDAASGIWPDIVPEAARHSYDLSAIKHWLEVFVLRFFQLSQFKRSAMPNAPKVGSGGSLSPRGDWRAPSDATADVWLEELRANVP